MTLPQDHFDVGVVANVVTEVLVGQEYDAVASQRFHDLDGVG